MSGADLVAGLVVSYFDLGRLFLLAVVDEVTPRTVRTVARGMERLAHLRFVLKYLVKVGNIFNCIIKVNTIQGAVISDWHFWGLRSNKDFPSCN